MDQEEDLGYYYRYVDVLTTREHWCIDGQLIRPIVKIELEEYRVLKRTPKGAWINRRSGMNPKTFVLDSSPKKVAWPTKIGARMHFFNRKKAQLMIHEERAIRAKEALWQAAFQWDLTPTLPKPAPLREVYGKQVLLGGDYEGDPDYDDIVP